MPVQLEQLDLSVSWNRLQYVYENASVKQWTEGHYGKYEADGELSVCGIGYALKSAGWTDDELVGMKGGLRCAINTLLRTKSPMEALNEYGFSKEDKEKDRRCPLPNCRFTGNLQCILEHLNEAPHKVPIPQIGKLIPVIKNDDREMPTMKDHGIRIKERFTNFLKELKI